MSKDVLLTLMLLVAAFATMAAQEALEQTAAPDFVVDTIVQKGFAPYQITIVAEPESQIYYKIMDLDDYNEGLSDDIPWQQYSSPLTISSDEMYFKTIEAYAITDGKLRSQSTYCHFSESVYFPWDFEYGGVYYTINESASDEALITYYKLQYEPMSDCYTGDIVIPAQVTDGEREFTVTGFYGEAFYGCGRLTSITLPNTIGSIGIRAFEGCRGLKTIDIPNSVTSIGWSAFKYSGLVSIEIPESVTVIESDAFSGCRGLTSVTCRAKNPPSAICSFSDYDQATLYVPAESLEAYRAHEEWGQFSHIVPIDEEVHVSPSISVTKGSMGYLVSIGCNVEGADIYYKLLSDGDEGDWTVYEGLIENTFLSAVMAYAVVNGQPSDTVTVVAGGDAWFNYVPSDFEENGLCYRVVGDDAVSLTYAYWNYEDAWGPTSKYNGDVVIPETVIHQGKTFIVTGIDAAAIYACGITGLFVPKTVTRMYGGFGPIGMSCSRLDSVVVDSENPVFDSRNNCNALIETSSNELICGTKSTLIPEDVVSIGSWAFSNREGLTRMVIPASVNSIGVYAFYRCQNLVSMTCKATIPPSAYDFLGDGAQNILDQAVLFVPAESLEAYQGDEEWGRFSRIVPFLGAGPGDINGDGRLSITDVTGIIEQLLDGGDIPAYCDVNGDGRVSITDVTTLINMLLSAQ